jgi:hypothetical protein
MGIELFFLIFFVLLDNTRFYLFSGSFRFLKVTLNGLQIGEGGDFHHKCVCGALNRHFCQTRVKGWLILLSL